MTVPSSIFFARTFHFAPNAGAAIAHGIAFAVVACALAILNWRASKPAGGLRRYLHLLPICAALEAVGYFARVPAITDLDLKAYIVQSFLILVVPIALALVQYITVGRLLEATGNNVWCMKPRLLSRLFLASDILCFILQAGGSGMMTQPSMRDMGQANAIAGIILQLAFYSAFVALTVMLAYGKAFKLAEMPQLRPVFTGLFVTIALIFVRNVYRIAQFVDTNTDGVFATSEYLFNGFETIAILSAFIAFGHWHFGRLLPFGDAALAQLVKGRGMIPSAASTESTPAQGASMDGAAAPAVYQINAFTASPERLASTLPSHAPARV